MGNSMGAPPAHIGTYALPEITGRAAHIGTYALPEITGRAAHIPG